jgi:hypothetical protein
MHIRIPIKRYLVKYLIARLGKDSLELKRVTAFEVALSENNIKATLQKQISDVIFPLLQSSENYRQEDYINNKAYTLVGLSISDNMMMQKKVCLRTKSITKINERIYGLMMDELMNRVFEALDEEKRIDTIILGFMAECNIDEDDIRFDSLKKNCYRKRTEIAEKLFLKNNSATAHAVLSLSFDTKLIR